MSVTLSNSTNNYDWRDRPETDFYPTPPEVTQALLKFLALPSKRIWEPACGKQHLSNELKKAGHQVFETDIQTGIDFLKQDHSYEAQWIITNPPFIIAEEFIRHCRKLNVEGFALLLKSQYWHSSKRFKLFEEIPPTYVLPLTWRPDFLFGAKSSSPTMEVLWTIWNQEYKGFTTYLPLKKP